MAFTDALEWPECNSDMATVGSVVCTVFTNGQPYKPSVRFETGLKLWFHVHSVAISEFPNQLTRN